MARRNKAKTKSKTKPGSDADSGDDSLAAHKLFLNNRLEQITELEKRGISLQKTAAQAEDPLLAELAKLVPEEELEMLKSSGAFGNVELKLTDEGKQYVESKDYQRDALGSTKTALIRPPPPPVPIFADFPGKSSSLALAGELRYLETVLHPAEMRWLVAELACDLLEKAPVTHTDISDAVIASIAPSTAQKVAFQADAQYKYTTAQFLQVYMKMRHVVLEHKIMLGGAKADALLLALSPYEFDPVRPEDTVPLSAVEALRQIIDSENTEE